MSNDPTNAKLSAPVAESQAEGDRNLGRATSNAKQFKAPLERSEAREEDLKKSRAVQKSAQSERAATRLMLAETQAKLPKPKSKPRKRKPAH